MKIDRRIASLNQCQENHSRVISFSADILSAVRRKYTITSKKISVDRYLQIMLVLKQTNVWKIGCLKKITPPKCHLKITKVYKPTQQLIKLICSQLHPCHQGMDL